MSIDDAVRYNKARGYPRRDWQTVQMVLAARPDGIPGKETATQVMTYQESHGLQVDGMVGPQTMGRMLDDVAPWDQIESVCVYWDRPSGWTLDNLPRLVDDLATHGIDAVKVMITNTSDKEWSPAWSKSRLAEFARALAARGIKCIVTAWALPYPAYLHGLRDHIHEWIEAAGAPMGELDAEEHLLERNVHAYPSDRIDLGRDLEQCLDAIRAAGVPCGVSTYGDLLGQQDRFINDLVSYADVYSLQAYQVAKDQNNLYNSNGPALKQYDGIKRSRERISPLPHPMSVAVAMWNQAWHPGGGADAQMLSVEQCVRAGIRHIDLWSVKHWLGPGQDPKKVAYNGEFLRRLRDMRQGGGCA